MNKEKAQQEIDYWRKRIAEMSDDEFLRWIRAVVHWKAEADPILRSRRAALQHRPGGNGFEWDGYRPGEAFVGEEKRLEADFVGVRRRRVISLPHQCDDLIIGGRVEAEALIEDLRVLVGQLAETGPEESSGKGQNG